MHRNDRARADGFASGLNQAAPDENVRGQGTAQPWGLKSEAGCAVGGSNWESQAPATLWRPGSGRGGGRWALQKEAWP